MTHGLRRPAAQLPMTAARARTRGFTLIEMIVVMVVIGILFTLVVPQFRSRTHADLRRSALRLAATIEHTFHQSAFRRETLRLHYDLEGSRYWLDRFIDPAAREPGWSFANNDAPENGPPAKARYVVDVDILPVPITLPNGVFITSVSTQYLEEATEGEAFTHFFPDGYAEPTVLYMADTRGGEYTLYVPPISGRVKVLPGHEEFDVVMKEERT